MAFSSSGGWTKTFTDPRLCAAIVDRLTFNGTIIETRHRLLPPRFHPSPNRTTRCELTPETAGLLVRAPVRLRLVEIFDVLASMAKTGRLGPVFSGADWNDVTAALGEP